MSEAPRTNGSGPTTTTCPSAELLLAYLESAVRSAEASSLDAHLDTCDPCLTLLAVAQQRLARTATMAEPVPDSVRQRTAVPSPDQAVARPTGDRTNVLSWPQRSHRRLSALPSWRTLLPVALAAGALFTVASRQWLSPQPPALTRGVAGARLARVTLHQALVRSEPNLHAPVVTTLSRGANLEVRDQERDWFRVSLPEGGEGWIEQRACR